MNSSSIVMAFFLAGIVSVTVHNVVFGFSVFAPPNTMHQTTTSNNSNSVSKNAKSIEQFTVKTVKIPL